MTIEEAKSQTVRPFQNLREKRKSGIEVGNIATVESSSGI